jgi:hypothetical protein
MDIDYIDLLNRRAYQEIEALATEQLSRAEDAFSVLMIAHSRIRRGLFSQAVESLYEYERLSPSNQAFVHDTVAMWQVPAFYKRSLAHPDPQIAAGRITNMEGPAPLGLRDYQFSANGRSGLFGIYQIRSMTFQG